MNDREWTCDKYACWYYRIDNCCVWIAARPSYCDRGHWYANAEGPLHTDHADSFPRYFMDLERAKSEMSEWLEWRLKCMVKTR